MINSQPITLGEFMDRCAASEQMKSAKDKIILEALRAAGPAPVHEQAKQGANQP